MVAPLNGDVTLELLEGSASLSRVFSLSPASPLPVFMRGCNPEIVAASGAVIWQRSGSGTPNARAGRQAKAPRRCCHSRGRVGRSGDAAAAARWPWPPGGRGGRRRPASPQSLRRCLRGGKGKGAANAAAWGRWCIPGSAAFEQLDYRPPVRLSLFGPSNPGRCRGRSPWNRGSGYADRRAAGQIQTPARYPWQLRDRLGASEQAATIPPKR